MMGSPKPSICLRMSGNNGVAAEADTLPRQLSMSEGTAGHVWRSRKPVWTNSLMRDMCLARSTEATEAGLQGGLWFAIKNSTTV